jgi:hypothetical protein
MKALFVKKVANSFFENKKARVLKELKNFGGEVIKEGMTVIITGKNHANKTYLDVQLQNIIFYGVDPENLELVKESEYSWPIEMDTLDLREHEF